jgi:hypothetical protein
VSCRFYETMKRSKASPDPEHHSLFRLQKRTEERDFAPSSLRRFPLLTLGSPAGAKPWARIDAASPNPV